MVEPISLPLLQRRQIEAEIVGPLVRAFAAAFGEGPTYSILQKVILELARTGGCRASEQVGGQTIPHLQEVIRTWNAGGALEVDILRADEAVLEFNVTRCRFAEMYRALGMQELGGLLSCQRDGAMIEGFNPEIQFQRTQTLMEGASHCDFRYRLPQTNT